jgi:hypothetical protein
MATRICFGIPHRVGACACELGKGREDQGVIEATETTTQFENIVANKTIDPGHKIISVAYADNLPADGQNDDATRLAVAISAWKGYPEESETDPKIIIKTKGDVSEGVGGSFPSIKITLRPLKTVLDYEYAGNLNASGQGEVGYESPGGTSDLLTLNYWEGPEAIPAVSDGWSEAYAANQSHFEYFVSDTMAGGPMITLTETHYFKSADRPGDEPTPWQPLTGLELDPTFNPRLPSMDAFGFGRNESFDCRYRFPQNYLTKFGVMNMQNGYIVTLPPVPEANLDGIPQGDWEWKNFAQYDPDYQPPLNPLFEPDTNDIYFEFMRTDQGVAPVVKGWYWDSATPPTNGNKGLFQSTNFKMIKEVRKRYPFSFVAAGPRTESYTATDHTEGNQIIRYFSVPDSGIDYFTQEPAIYRFNVTKDNRFKALAWWRMEIDAELCGWNSKKITGFDPETQQERTTIVGAKIKGHIKLGLKVLELSTAEQGLYSYAFTSIGGPGFFDSFSGIAPSFVYRCKVEPYFDENFIQRYTYVEYDGGEIPWEVTLDEENSKGKPIAFLDFPITSEAELPGQETPPPGTVPDNSLVYIKDFVVTEVILP